MQYKNESGRTSSELLATLGVIAVLTVGTIVAYNNILLKQQADSLFQDFKLRSSFLREQASNKKHLFSITEVGTMKRLGGTVIVTLDDPAPGFYSITTFYLKTALCQKLLTKDWHSIGATQVYIDDVLYTTPNLQDCHSDLSKIKVVFKSAHQQLITG